MNALVIYDETGYILSVRSGEPAPREPVGVPFLWVEVPNGKYVESVDVSVTPHQVVFGDRPPTIEEQLSEKEVQIFDLKEKQYATNKLLAESNAAQQDLLELLIDMGVI